MEYQSGFCFKKCGCRKIRVIERIMRKRAEKKLTQSCEKSGTLSNQRNARFFAQDMQNFRRFLANIARFLAI